MAKSEMFLFWWKLQLIGDLEHSSVIFVIIPGLLIVDILFIVLGENMYPTDLQLLTRC